MKTSIDLVPFNARIYFTNGKSLFLSDIVKIRCPENDVLEIHQKDGNISVVALFNCKNLAGFMVSQKEGKNETL